MSDYRPWDLRKPEPEPEAEPEAIEAPAAVVAKAREASPEDLEKTKVVVAPGTDTPTTPKGEGGRALAAMALLMGGGLLFISAILVLMATNSVIEVATIQSDPQTAREAGSVRGIAVPLLLIASAPGLVAGFGLVYKQPWAKPIGQVVAGLQVLTILGIPLGAMAFGGLAKWRPS